MDTVSTTDTAPVWWQTGLHIVAAVALFIPFIYLAGILAYVYDVFVQGYIGRSGEGIGFFIRGFQYFAAGVAALFVPVLLLKRTNVQIVGAIWTTIYVLLFAVLIALPLLTGTSRAGFWEWLEVAATAVGTLIAGVGFTIGSFRDGL